MTLALAAPPCPDSALRRLDPRWRLMILLLTALCLSFYRSLLAVLLALAFTLLLVVLARLPWRWYLSRIGTLALALAVFLLPLPFLLADPGHGLRVALTLAARAVGIVSLMLVLLASGPLDATLKAARSLGMPGLLVQVALLTYRYVFLLGDELARLRIALRVRGYKNRANAHSYRTIGHVAGTLLVRGAERAERVGQAMRCRGFDGRFRSLTDFRTTTADVVSLLAVVLVLAGLGLLDWFLR
jgi:cobalt/nickel transport system permease protein